LDGAPLALGTYTWTISASNGLEPDAQQTAMLTIQAATYVPLIVGGAQG
jgi:hypothetical protein